MPRQFEGDLVATGQSFAVVVSRFNDLITGRLLEGAIETFRRHGVKDDDVSVAHVPGSFELPVTASCLADSGRFAGVVCLGAVIQGQTTHHEYINNQVASGLMQVGLRTGLPVVFGVLTCQTMEQALDRAGGKTGNKGAEAALAAIEMASLLGKLTDH